MNSPAGQVLKMRLTEKVFGYIKKAKDEKIQLQAQNALLKELLAAKKEYFTLKQNLELITDESAKEYCIYRFKAAQLNLARYIKLAKNMQMEAIPDVEGLL